MRHYLQELDVTYFVSKSKAQQNIDLLILLEQFSNPKLEQLFDKIVSSIKLVNCDISYRLEFINNLGQIQDLIGKCNFTKVLVFSSDPNINMTNVLATSYNLNSNNILLTSSLDHLNNSLDTKKKLWHDLKNFLA